MTEIDARNARLRSLTVARGITCRERSDCKHALAESAVRGVSEVRRIDPTGISNHQGWNFLNFHLETLFFGFELVHFIVHRYSKCRGGEKRKKSKWLLNQRPRRAFASTVTIRIATNQASGGELIALFQINQPNALC